MITEDLSDLDIDIYGPLGEDIRNVCKRHNLIVSLKEAIAVWITYSKTCNINSSWKIPEDDEEIMNAFRKILE